MVTTEQFLRTVVTADEGFFLLLTGTLGDSKSWKETFYRWPEDLPKILKRVEQERDERNVYFSSYLYSQADSHKEYVLPSRTIQADLDNADITNIALMPTVLVETSPGRHQGYWILQEGVPLDEHEQLSKRITYNIVDCDRSGWPLGRKVRVAGSYNHKYIEDHQVNVAELSLERYTADDVREYFPNDPPEGSGAVQDDTWVANPPTLEVGPLELFTKYKMKLSRKVQVSFGSVGKDRSLALWNLMRGLFKAGADRDEVFWLAKHSANNKFADLRYNQDQDLAKDVLRAEKSVNDKEDTTDLKKAINEIRKLPGQKSERMAYMSEVIVQVMSKEGDFVESDDGTTWYLHTATGRPVMISRASQYLESLMESRFGLNASEVEYRYVIGSLMTHTHQKGKAVTTGSLSHYNKSSNVLLLHGGKKDIYAISAEEVNRHPNGTFNVMFPWRIGEEPFHLEQPLEDWTTTLFEGYFDNADGLTQQQATVLFKVWTLFILFRNAAISRPILALFGQPGSGKSTLFRLLYTLLYGPRKGLGSVTNPEDFDHAVSVDPFVVLDNVDTWTGWLPDRLALAAATSDILKRKLYTDADTIIVKRQAVLGVSAHSPRFGREDVVDRLLLINFHRLTDFKAETDLLDKVWKQRNRIWASIVADVQRILRTPMPASNDVVSFRIKDFALYGTWIARATGCEDIFRSAIESTKSSQQSFTMNEESVLIEAIRRWHRAGKAEAGKDYSAGELWTILSTQTSDPVGFQRAYKNSVAFGKKLWTLQEVLRSAFQISTTEGVSRRWIIDPK